MEINYEEIKKGLGFTYEGNRKRLYRQLDGIKEGIEAELKEAETNYEQEKHLIYRKYSNPLRNLKKTAQSQLEMSKEREIEKALSELRGSVNVILSKEFITKPMYRNVFNSIDNKFKRLKLRLEEWRELV